jgi:hypothetical protein
LGWGCHPILNTDRVIGISLYVVRAFIKLREMYSINRELAMKLSELDLKVTEHNGVIKSLVTAIKKLSEPQSKRRIGFHTDLNSQKNKNEKE